MNLLNLLVIAGVLFVSGCEKPKDEPLNKGKPPWGRWLLEDTQHPEKRLEVKFGEVLYQIPVSYLIGAGANQKFDDYSYMQAYISVSYPDLVPTHSLKEKNTPNYPSIEVILSGHKDDPMNKDKQNVDDWKKRLSDLKIGPHNNDVCHGPIFSKRASGMSEYVCDTKNHTAYFLPIDENIKTPSGNNLIIECNDTPVPGANYRCQILSPLYPDIRGVNTRIYLKDLNNLLDVYEKTIQLLSSLEAKNH